VRRATNINLELSSIYSKKSPLVLKEKNDLNILDTKTKPFFGMHVVGKMLAKIVKLIFSLTFFLIDFGLFINFFISTFLAQLEF